MNNTHTQQNEAIKTQQQLNAARWLKLWNIVEELNTHLEPYNIYFNATKQKTGLIELSTKLNLSSEEFKAATLNATNQVFSIFDNRLATIVQNLLKVQADCDTRIKATTTQMREDIKATTPQMRKVREEIKATTHLMRKHYLKEHQNLSFMCVHAEALRAQFKNTKTLVDISFRNAQVQKPQPLHEKIHTSQLEMTNGGVDNSQFQKNAVQQNKSQTSYTLPPIHNHAKNKTFQI